MQPYTCLHFPIHLHVVVHNYVQRTLVYLTLHLENTNTHALGRIRTRKKLRSANMFSLNEV